MKKLLCLSLVATLVVSCGSSKKKPKGEEITEKTYKLVETSSNHDKRPDWVFDPPSFDKEKVRKKYRYFVSESEGPNRRLVEKSSQVRATAKIAAEVAQFIKNSYAESVQGGPDDDVSEYMQEQLASETQAFVVGAETAETFWEKRRYLQKMGAEEDATLFKAYTLVKIDKKNVEKMIKAAKKRLIDRIPSETKSKTEKALKDVEKAFTNLDKPVEIKDVEFEDED